MQQGTVVRARLHVVAAIIETKAGLRQCLLRFQLRPGEDLDFSRSDCVVDDAACFLRQLRRENSKEVLCPLPRCELEHFEGEALEMVGASRPAKHRDESLEIFAYIFSFLSQLSP